MAFQIKLISNYNLVIGNLHTKGKSILRGDPSRHEDNKVKS